MGGGGRILLDACNAVIALAESSSNQLAVVAANMDKTQAGFSYCKGRVEDYPQTQDSCEAVRRGITQ